MEEEKDFIFGKKNYTIMLIGLAVIVLGLIMISGGGAENDASFSKDIFSFRRITLAPIVILSGFVIEIYAIMKR